MKNWILYKIIFFLFISFAYSQNKNIKFQNIPINDKLPSQFIKSLVNSKNYIWIASSNGIVRWNINNNTTTTFMKGIFITSLAIEKNEQYLWVGTPNGLYYLNTKNNKVKYYTKQKQQLGDNRVNCLLLTRNNTLYVGTFLGVDKFENNIWKSYTAFEGLAGANIQDISYEGNTIWTAGSDGLSFYDVNDDFWFNYSYDRGLTSNQLTSLTIDANYIWVGTTSSGVLRFNRIAERFDSYNNDIGVIDDTSLIQTIVSDGDYIWAGSFEGLLEANKNQYRFQVFQAQNGIIEPSIQTILIRKNNIYIGTDGKGIFIADKKRAQVSILQSSSYSSPKIFDIMTSVHSNRQITNLKVAFKAASEIKNKWLTNKIKIDKKNKNSSCMICKIAEFNISSLPDDTYIVKLEASDNKNLKNTDTTRIVVDNSPPKIRFSFREAISKNTKEIIITGRYEELNLKTISILNKKRPILFQVNKQNKTFKFTYDIIQQPLITIMLEDIAGNKLNITRTFSSDNQKPILIIPDIKKKDINANQVTIKGIVKDSNISKVIAFPGEIEANLTPSKNKNEYSFEVKINLRKEGVSQIIIQALDQAENETIIKKKLNFSSNVSLLELNKDLIKPITLKPFLEISGFVLGPRFKKIYIKDSLQPIIVINKQFKKIIPLVLGLNKIVIVGIAENNTIIENTLETEYINIKPSFTLLFEKKYYLNQNIILVGNYNKGIQSIYFEKKALELDRVNRTFQFKVTLKNGRNTISLTSIDVDNQTSKLSEVIYLDNSPPKMSISSFPKATGLPQIPIFINIEDSSDVNISIFPNIEIDNFTLEKKNQKIKINMDTNLSLLDGNNHIRFIARDLAGNQTERIISILYSKDLPKVSTGANYVDEINKLRDQITRLKQLLKQRKTITKVVNNNPQQSYDYKRNIPNIPGLFLFPLMGKIKSYTLASKIYFGDESFGDVIASFNGKNPQYLSQVLIPSSQLFQLLNKSKSNKLFSKVMVQLGKAYIKNKYKNYAVKQVLKYITQTSNFVFVKNIGKHTTLIKTKNNRGIIITHNLDSIHKENFSNYQLKEILVASINQKKILFKAIQ